MAIYDTTATVEGWAPLDTGRISPFVRTQGTESRVWVRSFAANNARAVFALKVPQKPVGADSIQGIQFTLTTSNLVVGDTAGSRGWNIYKTTSLWKDVSSAAG